MEQQTKTNLTNPDIWIRLIYMFLFAMMLMVARMVIWVVAVLQFLLVLVAGEDNVNLRNLGQGVAKWSYQALLFLTFNSDDKPFPFSDWPEIDEAQEPEVILASESGEGADNVPTFTEADRTETETVTDSEVESEKKTEDDKPSTTSQKASQDDDVSNTANTDGVDKKPDQ